jgi:hypothetical protein
MKKIIYLVIILFSSTIQISAKETNDCSGIKKLSREYMACKAGNFKTGLKNVGKGLSVTGEKIKENTVGKVKKKEKIKEKNKTSTANKIKVVTTEKALSFKEGFKGLTDIFKGSKQYPKGIKKNEF